MKRNITLLIIFFIFCFVVSPVDIHALSSSEYKSRHNCSKYELAGAHTDGSAVKVACYNTFDEAHNAMVKNGASDLIIFDETSTTKIVDAQYALVDVMKSLVYLYENANLTTRQYTGISGLASMGCADGAFISPSVSTSSSKVKFNGFTAWISNSDIEIVPINWVKSVNKYTVTNDSITHKYTKSIQDTNYLAGNQLGPKPDMLNAGTYYSYDGNYFYTTLQKMLLDYKNGNYNNAVNKNKPYYNYYQYLSIHSKTTYSSINIDDFVRNNLGYTKSIYGYKKADGSSALSGMGSFFYNSQQKYGVNSLISFSLARNESGNGRSDLVVSKNNGFGLDAVDSNPNEEADYFPNFQSGLYELTSRFLTYGMAYATDWRYFGPAFGNKMNGINVKYATDAYWSEKMASNYYQFDSIYGLNDYNYYQLGIINKPTNAYYRADTSKKIYNYPEYGDQLLIVGESGNYYKVMSDMNIDSNGNLVGNKNDYKKSYNWNNSYVYVSKNDVTLINKAKNGYKDPNSVTKYKDYNYSYEDYVSNGENTPRVAKLKNDTNYYNDSALMQTTGKKVLKDKLVMVYTAAYDENGKVVSYLITSDYFYNQKKWVAADSISFVSSSYGLQTVNTNGTYEWVCSKPIDSSTYKISGFYGGTYFPIIGEEGNWYKVVVSLDSNSNNYGYVLKTESGAHVDKYNYKASNNQPVISASDKTIKQGNTIDLKDGVSASDIEDGNITSKIAITGSVDTKTPGTYKVTYTVTDSGNLTTSKTISITVIKDENPVIDVVDKEVVVNTKFNPLDDVKATDKEDGDLTSKVVVKENNVDIKTIGSYKVVYSVEDSYHHVVEKEVKVSVTKDSDPVINATDKTVSLNSKFDPKDGVIVTDKEDKDITKSLKVEGSVDTTKVGTYKLTYSVSDSSNNKVVKEVNITVVEKELIKKDASFYFDYMKVENKKLIIKGYNTIKGINNNLSENIIYKIVFKNISNGNEYEQNLTRITNKNDMSMPVYSADKFDYTYSWFEGEIDIDNLPDGDYKAFIKSESSDYYSISTLSNMILREQVSYYKSKKYMITRSNYIDSDMPIEFIIRSEEIEQKTTNSIYNSYNNYNIFEIKNNKLHINGTSYTKGINLASEQNVERKIIFENVDNYKKYKYELGSITNGLYKVGTTLGDGLSKTRAWFDKEIDISSIPKGKYAIYISTKSNVVDYGELTELLLRKLDDAVLNINGKKYTFVVNKSLRYRIEMNVD